MPAANQLNDQLNPSWDDVVLRRDVIKAHPGDLSITLSVSDNDHLIAYCTEYGFLVCAHALGDHDFYVLVDNSLGTNIVSVWCAGDVMERQRKVFVGEVAALQAVRHYFETGSRDPELNWEVDKNTW